MTLNGLVVCPVILVCAYISAQGLVRLMGGRRRINRLRRRMCARRSRIRVP